MTANLRPGDGADTADEDIKFTLRLPKILHARIMAEAKKRQVEFSRYSAADWIKDTIRQRLDGPVTHPTTNDVHFDVVNHNAAPPPNIQPGRFADGFWDRWSRNSKRLEGEAKQESFAEALQEREAAGLKTPEGFLKMSPERRIAWLRINDREEW